MKKKNCVKFFAVNIQILLKYFKTSKLRVVFQFQINFSRFKIGSEWMGLNN